MAKTVMLVCLVLAWIAAISYILMGIGIIEPGDLISEEGEETMPVFYYIIPAGYIAIGFLVFVKKHWLWITLAAVNALTIVVFYAMYAGRPDVMLSAPGLITKIAQLLMEIGLIYLIMTWRRLKTTS